jgi:GNAT superfamily N-acetyltransferase
VNAPRVRVRRATAADAGTVADLVDGLLRYEKLPGFDAAARARLTRDGFGERPRFDAFLAEVEGRAVGYALVFETYSTLRAQPSLYLEDLFVQPEWRGRGAGMALLREVAAEALRRGCGRVDWVVLDWNRIAIDFYDRVGARRLEEWFHYRLEDEALRRVAGEEGDSSPP